jgi:hypothetical protein
MMVVVVMMPAMRMSNGDNHLRTRCGYQRREEQKGKEAKQNLFHTSSDAGAALGVVMKKPIL